MIYFSYWRYGMPAYTKTIHGRIIGDDKDVYYDDFGVKIKLYDTSM